MTEIAKNIYIRTFDRELSVFEAWAKEAGFDISTCAYYNTTCEYVTEFEESEEPSATEAYYVLLRIDRLFKGYMYHRWEMVSKYSGEVVVLYGEPGDCAADAMKKQGYDSWVWNIHKQLF